MGWGMPSRWLVALRKLTNERRDVSPKSVHSLVSTWLDRRPGSRQGVDHWDLQPYSVAWPQETSQHVVLSLRLMVDALEDVLLSRVQPGRVVRWNGHLRCLVPDDTLAIESVTRVSYASYDELLRPSRASTWRVTHDSPATHQRWGGRYECLHGIEDLLSRPSEIYRAITHELNEAYGTDEELVPLRVFGDKLMLSGLELWSAVEPAPVAESATRSPYRAPSAPSKVPDAHGAMGWTEWFARDPDFRRHVDAVLRIAEYSGVGHFTSAGFGAVTAEPVGRSQRP